MTDRMQTSLARRQRHRRNGSNRGSGGGGAASGAAIALPLFLFGTLALLAIVGFGSVVAAYSYYSQGLPDPLPQLNNITFSQETVVYDRTGTIELARFGAIKRTVIPYSAMPPALVDATTSIEDKTFWQNAGFDPIGILSAALDTVTGNARGASTITQQLVRGRLLPDSAFAGSTYERKIREIIQSIRLTQELPPGDAGKQEIMAAYLNQNFYGNQSYGIAAAAESYFGITDLTKLDLAQAAILAGIPQSPSTYDLVQNAVETCSVTPANGAACPAGKTVLEVPATSAIVQRRNHILDLMEGSSETLLTHFTDAQYQAAKNEPVILTPPASQRWLAPQFVWQVRHQLGTILCPTTPDTCEQVDTGGYKVITTLDYHLQAIAEKWVKAAAIAPNAKNPAAYLKSINVPYEQWIRNDVGRGIYNAALAAMDYRTGQVVAYVGSADYYAPPRGAKFQPQFDVLANGWRQPGSSFKGIGYLAGIEDHVTTAATMFMDVVTNFGGGYAPGDADLTERGPVRLREAIQLSLNIPAIKAAIIEGPDKVFNFAKQMGIVWQNKTNPGGASIAIGTVEVHFIDLIGAYGAIANSGKLMPRTTLLSVTEPNGKVDWPPTTGLPPGRQAVSPQAAFIMQDILASNTDPKSNPFWSIRAIYSGRVRRPAALKTGTSTNEIDLAAMGFLPPPKDPKAEALVVGAWMGNSDNSIPPHGSVALETAASLWQSFLEDAVKGTPVATFAKPPAGVVQATVDANSGMLPGPYTKRTIKEYFIDGTVPTQVDDTKVGVQIDSATGLLWQDGCLGPEVTKGFLDFSNVEPGHPTWVKYTQGWVARAMHGPGVRGGPKDTPTDYFHFGHIYPFGATWGAPFPPVKKCPIGGPPPSPPPGSPPPSDQPSPLPSF
ncbi:MAG TPA: transglycosylase domain-containing protein [Candidatus Limnocylindrales bacterium]|nr:transglycosylase domain-containing protein [Candidatus Limnocylindrales bacterium]